MTEIALLRHFPTAWNQEARLQGQSDQPLTEQSRRALGALALPAPWCRRPILASPLSRALDTARILANGGPVATDPRLLELSWGIWEGRRSADLLAEPGSGFVPTHQLGWTTRPHGGESAEDAYARVAPLLAELAQAGRPTLLVTHKALMRCLLRMAAGGPGAPSPEIKRARLYPLTLTAEGRPTKPRDPVRLVPR